MSDVPQYGDLPSPPPPPLYQPPPAGATHQLSSPGRRLGAYALDGLLIVVTLVIGWLIWSIVVWGEGYTPAKKLLKMRTIKKDTGQPATWGTMFLREIVGKFVVGIVASVTLIGFVLNFWLLWDKDNQQLWDKIASTVVVDE